VTSDDLVVIDYLLQAPVAPARITVFSEWTVVWKSLVSLWETPVDRALAGGYTADRPAWAFAAGYQAALQRLVPAMDPARIAAICITEEGGPHPARIQCRLTAVPDTKSRWRLDGTKKFVSGATGAEILFVAATTGKTANGRNALRMATVPADRNGVTVTTLSSLGVIPEMPHGRVCLDAVALTDAALWPGDGYTNAIKPFRTIEDLHVTGAFLAWIFAVGRRSGWPAWVSETLLSLMVTIRTLAMASPLEPHVHLVLGGLLAQVRDFLQKIDPLWQEVDARDCERWRRDRKVLAIAETARQHRLEAARSQIGRK
jgi:acyl-CoA dehydrogenase